MAHRADGLNDIFEADVRVRGDLLTDKGLLLIVEEHGADANVERPNTRNRVQWVGSVEPLNANNFDTWIDTS